MKPINLRIAEELGVREQQVAASRRASATAHRERGLARHDGQLYLVPAHQNGCFAGLPGSTPPALAAPRERPTPSSSLRLSHGPARYPEPDFDGCRQSGRRLMLLFRAATRSSSSISRCRASSTRNGLPSFFGVLVHHSPCPAHLGFGEEDCRGHVDLFAAAPRLL